VSGSSGTAQDKMATLEKRGVHVVRNLSELGSSLKKIL
jgi:succinyl-CoA synthetase alpha subunit